MKHNRRLYPSISALRALEAVDRLGSASAAAQDMSLTQGAISRQLKTLESQLGIELIRRDRKRLALTPATQDYVAECRQALQQIAAASLRLQAGPAGGALNLAILPTFGMRWLVPRLPDFAKRHPDITINMTTQLERFNFSAHHFDVAIHFGKPDWPDADHLLLKYETIVPICAPDLIPKGGFETAQALLNQPLLHIQTRPDAWRNWFAAHGAPQDAPPMGTMYDQFSTITQAALHGLGIALLPDYIVEQDLAANRLCVAYGAPIDAGGAYYLVWPKSRANTPALKLFRAWLAEQAQPEDPIPR